VAGIFRITAGADYNPWSYYDLGYYNGTLVSSGIGVNDDFGLGTQFSPMGFSRTGSGAIAFLFYSGSGNLDATSGGLYLDASDLKGNVDFQAGDFADVLIGGAGNDSLVGGAGNDSLDGRGGSNLLDGGLGIDTARFDGAGYVIADLSRGYALQWNGDRFAISTTVRIENLIGSAEADTLTGHGAANVIDGGAGDDRIDGGAGDDTLIGGLGNDLLIGGAGIDTVSYVNATGGISLRLDTTAAQNTVNAGFDTLSGIENITGSAFGDSFRGNDGNNVIAGGDGNDAMQGGLGDDSLIGGLGTDTAVYSSATAAVIVNLGLTVFQNTGGAGRDRLVSIENLIGSAKNDTLTGSGGINELDGGSGNDLLYGMGGNDELIGGLGIDKLYGGDNNDVLRGGDGNDQLAGDDGNDQLFGDVGDDILHGFDGNDTIIGGIGNDTIYGDAGKDSMTGGTGADRFRLLRTSDSGYAVSQRDEILDFSRAQGDKIDLSAIDAKPGGANDAFTFVASFTGAAGQLRVVASGADWLVSGDIDGNRTPDFGILVSSPIALAASDFIL